MKKTINKNRIILVVLALVTLALLVATVAGLIYYNIQIDKYNLAGLEKFNEYSNVYAFISDDAENNLSDSLYEEMVSYGKENDCYVERMGSNLAAGYTKQDLIDIAIESQVSGIILEGDSSDETAALVAKAEKSGIPVVTVLTDCPNTARKSFIGMNNYSVGTDYGTLVLRNAGDKENASVLVLMNSENTNENTIYSAIQRKVSSESPTGSGIKLSSQVVTRTSAFNIEENIKDIIDSYDKLPDVIVCLSDINTRSVYQCIVERNKVGSTTIIGYYDSETVLKAIERGAIYATTTVATSQMARYCVDALNEYIDTGYVSEYFGTDYELITKDNIARYMEQKTYEKD